MSWGGGIITTLFILFKFAKLLLLTKYKAFLCLHLLRTFRILRPQFEQFLLTIDLMHGISILRKL